MRYFHPTRGVLPSALENTLKQWSDIVLVVLHNFRDALEQSLAETEPKASANADGDAKPEGSSLQLPSDSIGVSAGNATSNGY